MKYSMYAILSLTDNGELNEVVAWTPTIYHAIITSKMDIYEVHGCMIVDGSLEYTPIARYFNGIACTL